MDSFKGLAIVSIFFMLAMVASGCVSGGETTTTMAPTTTLQATTTIQETTTTESTTTTVETTTTTVPTEVDGVTQGIYGTMTLNGEPYEGSFSIKSKFGLYSKTVKADADGKFAVTLENDQYVITPVAAATGETAPAQDIIVKLGKLTSVSIDFE